MKKEKVLNISAVVSAGFHLCVCGLPMLAALVGIASPFAGIIPPALMNALLLVAGVSLAVSWAFYFKGCGCGKKLLLFSTFLFIAALTLHFIPTAAPTAGIETCH